MKTFLKKFLIISSCLFFIVFLVPFIGFKLYEIHLIRPILHSDHKAVLEACRTMIAERQNYHNDRQDSKNNPGDPVVIYPVKKSEIPAIIKNMNPKYIRIYKDHVDVCFGGLPRIYLFGFAEGAKQYGTKRLIDGLWIGSSI